MNYTYCNEKPGFADFDRSLLTADIRLASTPRSVRIDLYRSLLRATAEPPPTPPTIVQLLTCPHQPINAPILSPAQTPAQAARAPAGSTA
jgi:hypothetical protein